MRREVLLADVGLELDDPPDPALEPGRGVTDEMGAQQRAGGLEAGTGESAPIDDAGLGAGRPGQRPVPGKKLRRSLGMSGAVTAKNVGISWLRKSPAVSEPL
jgi:hypothetical protein